MGLREYKAKRHFERTTEPEGKVAEDGGNSFVVQKHAASHLHYDFRLELDGVLTSWAVPKGPSLDPSVKRLAMQVEDHPVEYGGFEGIIPEGEYGGGTVMLWDRGTWEPVGDAHEGFRTGRLKFVLHGEKLRGGWMLVRGGGRYAAGDERKWLLFKERDDEAQAEGDITAEATRSVSSGRDMDEIASAGDRVWSSKRDDSPASDGASQKKARRPARVKRRASSTNAVNARGVAGARKSAMPRRIEVQLATLAKEAPAGDDWLHEIKFDGYRMIGIVERGKVRFVTRNHKDWTAKLGYLAGSLAQLPVKQAILDGEVVAMRPDGTTGFQELQNAFRDNRQNELLYYVFDLLYLDGLDLTEVPLVERKRVLAALLGQEGTPGNLRLSEHIEGNGPAFLEKGCKMQLEGIVSKRRDSLYRAGRGYDWLKIKCLKSDEFVIGGYTEPAGSRTGFGALLAGYHDKRGDLLYAGKVGTGFDERTLRTLHERLQKLERDTSPFANLKRGPVKTHWLDPKLVAQVVYGEMTRDGKLRHASFQGVREDKPAAEVTWERAVPVEVAVEDAPMKSTRGSSRKLGPAAARRSAATKEAAASGGAYDKHKQEFAGVRLTSPDKVLYPEQGVTKLELATYYQTIADWILPHLADRPLVLVRCPEGRAKECFYQKHPAKGTPTNLRQIPIRESKKLRQYVVVDDVGGLISLAQIGALEIHAWGSRADKLEQPDRLIFDLDPDPAVPWARVVQAARQVRAFLEELGLRSFVKTTGGKGLHLVVPIERRHEWDEVKAFCKLVAESIVAADPEHYTSNMAKAARGGKIFLDYLRNGRGATAVAPYSTRARPGATVSVPLTWEELSAKTTSDRFNIRSVPKRLASLKKDPWTGIDALRQGLDKPMKMLETVSKRGQDP